MVDIRRRGPKKDLEFEETFASSPRLDSRTKKRRKKDNDDFIGRTCAEVATPVYCIESFTPCLDEEYEITKLKKELRQGKKRRPERSRAREVRQAKLRDEPRIEDLIVPKDVEIDMKREEAPKSKTLPHSGSIFKKESLGIVVRKLNKKGVGLQKWLHNPNSFSRLDNEDDDLEAEMRAICEEQVMTLELMATLYFYLVNRGYKDCTDIEVLELLKLYPVKFYLTDGNTITTECLVSYWSTIRFKPLGRKAKSNVDKLSFGKRQNAKKCKLEDMSSDDVITNLKEREVNDRTHVFFTRDENGGCPDPECICNTSIGHLKVGRSTGMKVQWWTLSLSDKKKHLYVEFEVVTE